MVTQLNTNLPTAESFFAGMQELREQQKENERILNEKFAETDRRIRETERILKEMSAGTERKIDKVNQALGAWATNHGRFAEEYFINSFESGKTNFFGEKFDEIEKNLQGIKKNYRDEYDLVLINGKTVGIVEIRFKAHENDIPTVLRKAETFRVNFPDYEKFNIYLGIASMSFYPELEEECLRNGLAVIKQVGETIVINDSNLKAY